MQRNGHTPIALVGGGTGRIGDPSGKNEMRQMIILDTIEKNVQGIKKQLSRFLDFGDGKAILANNTAWLASLGYIPFLRDIGRHFSISQLVDAELNQAKEILAFESTCLAHGREAAVKAQASSSTVFGNRIIF